MSQYNFDDQDFPLLFDVVRHGDPKKIAAAKHAHVEWLKQQPQPVKQPPELDVALTANTNQPKAPTPVQSLPTLTSILSHQFTEPAKPENTALMEKIEEIIERHNTAMRQELHALLKHPT